MTTHSRSDRIDGNIRQITDPKVFAEAREKRRGKKTTLAEDIHARILEQGSRSQLDQYHGVLVQHANRGTGLDGDLEDMITAVEDRLDAVGSQPAPPPPHAIVPPSPNGVKGPVAA